MMDNKWQDVLSKWTGKGMLFDDQFLKSYGDRAWNLSEQEKASASSFHVELISRVATQPLGYSDGTEEAALGSLRLLFDIARQTTKEAGNEGTFEIILWHALNTFVRPFTSRWHPKLAGGALKALDATDVFRDELVDLQVRLIQLAEVLAHMTGHDRYRASSGEAPRQTEISNEMSENIAVWRPMGESVATSGIMGQLKHAEQKFVEMRRATYGIDNRQWASGLALSGGGIRSATFALGVLAALAKRNLLPQFDYLSTVSGGGYAGSFLTQLMGSPASENSIGLNKTAQPFARVEGESALLRKVRNGASYLAGSKWERLSMILMQGFGLFLNLGLLTCAVFVISFAEWLFSKSYPKIGLPIWGGIAAVSSIVLIFSGSHLQRNWAKWAARISGTILCTLAVFSVLRGAHIVLLQLGWAPSQDRSAFLWESLKTLGVIAIGLVSLTAIIRSRYTKARPLLSATLTLLFLFGFETLAYNSFAIMGSDFFWYLLIFLFIAGLFYVDLDVNYSSLHPFYRKKLAEAFLLGSDGSVAKPIKFSSFVAEKALFPILNCAINLPGSKRPEMRGRQSDLFSFTPVSAGANVIGYDAIQKWEEKNPALDLATAMALSGAAVSPQSGLTTKRNTGFWLTILNLRLGQWLLKPGSRACMKHPNFLHLVKESLSTADETGNFVNISDGGHIENLGVYELLRRRCRFIVAVDGEQDPAMTFHGLANLQRLAYIDLGVTIDIELDDLRLRDQGLSRSHFRFCRIRYPSGVNDETHTFGYMIYLKLSLTGNEGEFIRRLKFDEPEFPHHSTANQFFTEVQFEAYRSLGEHVGDKMFLRALTGPLEGGEDALAEWFVAIGKNFLDPLSASNISMPSELG